MQAIWSGSISFGLVNIPIKLYSGSEERSLDLTMLHKKDMSPIRYAKICRAEEKEIAYEDVVKGFEYEKGEYVVLTEQDFEKASSQSTHIIAINEFTDEQAIDIRFFEKPYYLEPEKGGDKAYALLREALKKSKKVAVATFVLRNREHLAVIKPIGKVLVLNRIRFATEIRSANGLKLPEPHLTNEKEITMALALIDQLSHDFKAEDFHDQYSEDLEKAIIAKSKGRKITQKAGPKRSEIPNLMAALKASLGSKVKPKPTKKKPVNKKRAA